jgi:hypothetical protein
MKLMTGALIPWRDGRGQLCRVGFEYSPVTDRIEAIVPEDPRNIVLFDAVKAHLASGHYEVLEKWEAYKKAVLQHSQKVAEFLEGIRKQIISSAELPQYHHLMRQKEPDEYILPVGIAEQIYTWLHYESTSGKQWSDSPKIGSYIEGDTRAIWFTLGSSNAQFGKARRQEKFYPTMSSIYTIRDTAQNKQTVDQLVKTEREELPFKEKQFEDEINKIIRSIDLGNCLRGKCEDCPK